MKYVGKMLMSLGFAVPLMCFPSQVHATSTLECTGINSDSEVSVLFGAGPLLNALEVEVVAGKKFISTRNRVDTQRATVVQFSADEKELNLDLMDDQAEKHLVSIRILRHLDEDGASFQIGFLRLDGAFPVGITCIGP